MSQSDLLSEALSSPEPTQRFHGATPKLGAPFADFLYRTPAGRDILHVTRYKRAPDASAPALDDGPITRFWTWSASEGKWGMGKAAPRPALLWQADLLCASPELPVYLFDSEEAAQAFQSLLTEHDIEALATTWAGGAAYAPQIDLQPLAGRGVMLWPAKSSEAQAVMLQISGRLFRLLDESGHSVGFVRVSDDKPTHWDVAQAVKDGWGWDAISEFMDRNSISLEEAPSHTMSAVNRPSRLTKPLIEISVAAQGEPPLRRIKALNGSMTSRWREYGVSLAPNGYPHMNIYNVGKVIAFHKGAYCDVWMDEFHNKIMTAETDSTHAREWTEADTLEFTRFIQDPEGVNLSNASPRIVHEAVVLAASKNKRNEVREWLEGLVWDGMERLDTAFPLGWGTEDSAYYKAIGRCFIMGAVARILQPGCQVDTLPVFEGPEGIFKSSALMTLASDQWYDSPTYELGDFDFLQSLSGKWILELAEMANLNGAKGDKIKAVITRRHDTYRSSYARMPMTHQRMCVFAATVNDEEWNNSQFGARRFWPVECSKIDLGLIKEMREQWFAEAVARVNRNEKWYDIPLDDLKTEQAKRVPSDLWDNAVVEFLFRVQETSLDQVARVALSLEPVQQTPPVKHRITAILKKSGWHSCRSHDGKRVWRRVLGTPNTSLPPLDGPLPGF